MSFHYEANEHKGRVYLKDCIHEFMEWIPLNIAEGANNSLWISQVKRLLWDAALESVYIV